MRNVATLPVYDSTKNSSTQIKMIIVLVLQQCAQSYLAPFSNWYNLFKMQELWTCAHMVHNDSAASHIVKVTYFSWYGSCTDMLLKSKGTSDDLQGIRFAFKHGMWHLSAVFFWDIQIYNVHGKVFVQTKNLSKMEFGINGNMTLSEKFQTIQRGHIT
jgi:hypothetical protein